MSTHKSISMLAELKDELHVRFPTLGLFDGFVSGDPTLAIRADGTLAGTAGQANLFIKITTDASLQVNLFGGAQPVFTPHTLQVVYEEAAAGALTVVTAAMTLLQASLMSIATRGCKVEVYAEDNATVPLNASITGAKLVSTWEPSTKYPLLNQQ